MAWLPASSSADYQQPGHTVGSSKHKCSHEEDDEPTDSPHAPSLDLGISAQREVRDDLTRPAVRRWSVKLNTAAAATVPAVEYKTACQEAKDSPGKAAK